MLGYAFYETDNRIRRYAETLVRRGDAVDALVLRREGQVSFEVIKGVHVHRIQKRVRDEGRPLGYLIKMLMFFLRSASILALRHLRARYDIIHVHSVPDFEVFATIVPKLLGAKVVLDIHDLVPEFYGSKFKVSERSYAFRFLLLIEKLSTAYSNHVIISNQLWYAKLIQRSVKPEKCTTIINYPDPTIFFSRPRPSGKSCDFVMCYPGTLNRHQGVDLAIAAVAQLCDKLPNLKFLIIGDGPDREKLRESVQQRHLEQRVEMVGSIPIEQVAKTMAGVDLGVVPKRCDSFGNEAFSTKIMEFMAMGVPVIVSRTRIDEHYFNDRLVTFFESDNVEDLANKILEVADDSTKRESLRARGLEFIQQNNWDVKQSIYLGLADSLLNQRPRWA